MTKNKKNKDNFQHYYSRNPSSPFKKKNVKISLNNGTKLNFVTASGVFSFSRIDRASHLLIEHCEINTQGSLLDMGCGYGLIGISLKRIYPDIELFMSDINERACTLSKINARDNNIEAVIRTGNIFEPWVDRMFDSIVLNPPFAAGKKIWEKMIIKAPSHLKKEGRLNVVAYHNKGGSRIERIMRTTFTNVRTLVKSGGIRDYVSVKL
ncbi:MAG: class I SAM-dependent methyltransferase [Kosmotoga sp.]|nr:MAG: class I SAM-dependent methyltransferase [Kosmotoga sp.]